MSDRQLSFSFKENKLPIVNIELSSLALDHSETMDEIKGRVTLQTLQPSARVKGLVGSHGQIMNSSKDGKPRRKMQTLQGKISVFEDKITAKPDGPTKTFEDKGLQTEVVQPDVSGDVKSMTSDDITVEYWSTLAERRRLALTEALEENIQLHTEIDCLKTEMDALKTENALLKPMAEEAQYLASVLKELVGSEEEEATPNEEEASQAGEQEAGSADN